MFGKLTSRLLCLAFAVGLSGVSLAGRSLAASGTLDFGNTANSTPATTANTGFGGVRVGSGGGSFTIMNPGQEIGAQAELRGIAPTGTSVNSVGVTSTEYGTAATVFTVAFEVYFSGGSGGTWYFFAGNGASFAAAQTTGFTGSETFTGLRFVYGASNAITTNNRNAGAWNTTGISGTPFAQNAPYTVSVIGNNSASAVDYGSGTVAADKYDLWVNGILVGDDLTKALLANGTTINAFRFYGESSVGNLATINLDNIRWWNQAVPPSMSSYSTVSSVPALTYSVLNMNSGNASLAGAVTVSELLSLNSGNLTLGANDLTLGTSATVGGTPSATSMVVADSTGTMCKTYTAAGLFIFPIGDNTGGTAEYSPATLNFSSGTFSSAQACVRVTDAKHPNNTSTTDYLTRYWTVTQSGVSSFSCDTTFTYVDADIAGTESNIWTGKWNGATWSRLTAANTAGNTIGGTVTGFSDFTGGESAPMAVTLADFGAAQQGDAILLTWETNSELSNRGFNLYRGTSPSGWDRQLNSTLIPSQSQGNPGGFIYTWEDRADLVYGTSYFYWVEDVNIYNVATMHGPVSVDYTVPTAVTLSGIQATPAVGPALPLAGALLALLAPLAGALAVRRRRA